MRSPKISKNEGSESLIKIGCWQNKGITLKAEYKVGIAILETISYAKEPQHGMELQEKKKIKILKANMKTSLERT